MSYQRFLLDDVPGLPKKPIPGPIRRDPRCWTSIAVLFQGRPTGDVWAFQNRWDGAGPRQDSLELSLTTLGTSGPMRASQANLNKILLYSRLLGRLELRRTRHGYHGEQVMGGRPHRTDTVGPQSLHIRGLPT